MTYVTGHLLIGGGIDLFSGGGTRKIIAVYGGGGGHYMKNKNKGGCVLSTQPDQQKMVQCKLAQKCKNYQTLKFFPRSFSSLGILQNSYFWSS